MTIQPVKTAVVGCGFISDIAEHGSLGLVALRAGKSVYNEKPLAISRAEGRLMLAEIGRRSKSMARPVP